jgi:hypothetical protein
MRAKKTRSLRRHSAEFKVRVALKAMRERPMRDAQVPGDIGHRFAAAHQGHGVFFELTVVATRELAFCCFHRFGSFLSESPSPENRRKVSGVDPVFEPVGA